MLFRSPDEADESNGEALHASDDSPPGAPRDRLGPMTVTDWFRSNAAEPPAGTLWMVTVTEECGLLCDLTDYDTIARVMTEAGHFRDRVHDRWVGPGPRVTRRGAIGGNHSTTAAWLFELGPRPTADRPRATVEGDLAQLKARIEQGMASIHNPSTFRRDSTWGAVNIVPFSAAVNGPLAWWSSGQAVPTATRHETPDGSLMADDNPVGPNTRDSAPTRLFDGQGGGSPVALIPLALGALGLVGAIVLAPSINTVVGALVRPRAPAPPPWQGAPTAPYPPPWQGAPTAPYPQPYGPSRPRPPTLPSPAYEPPPPAGPWYEVADNGADPRWAHPGRA